MGMARPLRFIPPNSLVEVTCRTLQSRLLLRPSPALSEIIVGIVGRAQRRYAMQIHAFVFLSNHYHLLVTARSARQLAAFMGYVNSNLAREAGRLQGWRQKFWGRRYQAIVVSDEDRSQVARLEYVLAHGAKEGLVLSPKHWPGVHCVHALLDPTRVSVGTWFDRSAEFRARLKGMEFGARTFASVESVALTPIPAWEGLSVEERRRRAAEIVERIEHEAKERHRETSRQPLGRAQILRQRPDDQPVRSKRSPAPLIHAATKAARSAWCVAYRAFVAAYRRASEAFRNGLTSAAFPDHCFLPPPGFFEGYSFTAVPVVIPRSIG